MRILVVTGLLLATLLAGCISGDETPTPVTNDDESPFLGQTLPVGAQRHLPWRSFEPTLGTTSDGAIFMSTFDGPVGDKTFVAKSIDHGLTWTDVTPRVAGVSIPPQSNDPYIYVDPDTDRVFSSDLQALVCSTLSWSDDGGASWDSTPIGCGHPFGVHDHQTVFTSRPRAVETVGYPNVVHYCINRVADSACAFSVDGGRTFGPLRPLVYPGVDPAFGGLCGGLHAHGAADPDGRIFLPKGHCGVPMVAVSEDDGLTWKTHAVSQAIGISGHELPIAVDEAGNLHAFWLFKRLPYYAVSTDHGQTWSDPVMIAPENVTKAQWPTIAAGADGRAVMAYYGTASTKDQGDMDSEDGNDTWNAYMTVLLDATGNATWETTTLNPIDDPVARGACSGRCGSVGDFIDVVIDAEGRPWAALVDMCLKECSTTPGGKSGSSGLVGTLAEGPALRGELRPLGPLQEASYDPEPVATPTPTTTAAPNIL